MRKIVIIFASILLFAQSASGLTKYGDVTINKGSLILVRNGQTLRFTDPDQTYEILKNDVLKVGPDSMITLNTVQNTIVKMGSNAVFQVRPWKQKKKRGYLRMLYGKALVMTRKIYIKKDRFHLKTATAVAGVRGSLWKPEVTSNGILEIEVREGKVGITPTYSRDVEILVNKGQRSVSLNGIKATEPTAYEPEKEPPGLDSVPPTAKESVEIDNKEFYVENDLTDMDAFEESEKETADIDEIIEEPEEIQPESKEEEPDEETKDEPEETIDEEADKDFEEDLAESEDLSEMEVIDEIPLDLPDTMKQDDIIDEGVKITDDTPEIDFPDASDILDDASNTVDDAVNENLQQQGNVKIIIEK